MTQLGEGVAIGVVSSSDPNSKPKRLKASIVEFTWGGGIKVSEGAGSGRSTIETPHWKEGLNVADGEKSKRPGVLIVGGAKGTGVATAKIRIDENLNVSGDELRDGDHGDLTGRVPHPAVDPKGGEPDHVGVERGDGHLLDPPAV